MSSEKRREQLFVTVPSFFRCPISMDVMKSPVSLCTGVTYDRSSIEKWLALGHKTCPATMQTLPSTNTTPNLTLRRLIQLWISQGDVTPAISKEEISTLITGEFDSNALTKVIGFINSSEENLKSIAQSDAVQKLVKTFAKSDNIKILELIVEVLYLISKENGVRDRLNQLILQSLNCLSSFTLVLQKGSTESKVNSARVLELIAINSESQRKIAEKTGLLQQLYNLCDTKGTSIEAGMSALLAVSTTRPVRKELIRFGMVKTIVKILSGSDYSSAARTVIEKSLKMLELVATCTEGRAAITEERECVVEIVKRLMKCSDVATGHGITVLWSVCCLARDGTAQENVAKVNGLTRVLLVMQSDCSSNTRFMCGELVKVLKSKNIKSNLAPYETKTTHITPY